MFLGEGRGMKRSTGKKGRRRCCECRCWYTPAPSAMQTQMTCGGRCRLRRRARQERGRREADLEGARAADRERQRDHRRRIQVGTAPRGSMSQAGLSVQASESIKKIIDNMEQAHKRSQDGLGRQLRRLAQLTQEKIARASARSETRRPDVTGGPRSEYDCNCSTRRSNLGTCVTGRSGQERGHDAICQT